MASNERLFNDSLPLTRTEIQNIQPFLSEYICKIIIKNGSGSGFFCKIDDLPVMITNNHVLNKDDMKTGEIIIEINNSKKVIKLHKERKRFTDESIDITFIEINEEVDDLHCFFEIDKNYKTNDFCNIFLLHFPGGGEASISYGKIEKVSDTFLFYSVDTLPGSSGGVILNRSNYKVIGIHKGSSLSYNQGIIIKRGIEACLRPNYLNDNHVHNLVEDSGWICFCANCRKGYFHYSGYKCNINGCRYELCSECYRTKAKIHWGPLNHPHRLEVKYPLWFTCDNCKERWWPFKFYCRSFYCSTCNKYYCWVCYYNIQNDDE